MYLDKIKFEELVAEVIDSLDEKYLKHLNNVALFVEDFPTPEQMDRTSTKSRYGLLGLFEGYGQAKRINFGAVLPDKITIFRKPIINSCSTLEECRNRIISTVKHEIAHHFGSDEIGARKAGHKA